MRRARPPLPVLALLLALAAPTAAQQAEGGKNEPEHRLPERPEMRAKTGDSAMHHDDAAVEEAVRAVVSEFRRALRSGDSTAALAVLAPDARVYEGGHAETREEYRDGHLAADMAFLRDVTTETTWDTVVNGHEMALYLSESRVTGALRGREIDSLGVETIVLVPTEEGWKIRHIHWSSR